MGRIITNLVIWLMRNTRFSFENRTKLVNSLLDKLVLVPHKDILSQKEGKMTINGKSVGLSQAAKMRDSAKSLLDNYTRSLVREQVAFKAVNIGVHNANTPEEVYWAKVALWIYQQEDILYEALAMDEAPQA